MTSIRLKDFDLPLYDGDLEASTFPAKARELKALFDDGVRILEQKSGCPSLGVFPMLEGATIQQEDSVSLDDAVSDPDASIAIIRLPRISNFTDFRLLRAAWISRPVERDFAWVILPGTKNTIGDLEWLRQTGLDAWIRRQQGKPRRDRYR